jgi:chromosome segregation DNA-binding protein
MATQKRNALGRGLDALLSMDDVKTEGSSSISEIELAKITVNPNQPRREFDQTALQELADFHCGNRYHPTYYLTQTLGR